MDELALDLAVEAAVECLSARGLPPDQLEPQLCAGVEGRLQAAAEAGAAPEMLHSTGVEPAVAPEERLRGANGGSS